MDNVMGRIHSIETFGTLDGPGVRYVLFFQGCPMRCLYCHNPDSWSADGGRVIGSEEVVRDIAAYYNFIKKGGVTLSGGEPLLQPEFALSIIRGCHELGGPGLGPLSVAIDTAGAIPLPRCAEAVAEADLLLLDMKASEPALFKTLTGVGMENTLCVLDARQRLFDSHPDAGRVWIRHVLVPGLTLEDGLLHKLGALLQPYSCIERVELLPFHKMGEYKWKELGMSYTLADTPPPTPEAVAGAKAILAGYGLPVSS